METKTIFEWAEHFNSRLRNLDGFDENKDWENLKVTKETFLQGARVCTMELSQDLIKEMNDNTMRII